MRSSLAKNALILIEEMCDRLKKSMNTEISELVKILLRKTSDTNIFIAQQAKKTLEKMMECLSEQKLMPFILFHAQNARKPLIKAEIAFCFGRIFRKAKESVGKIRDIEKALQFLAEFSCDAAIEVRNATKEALDQLVNSFQSVSDFDLLLIRSLKESEYQKIQKLLEKKIRSASPVKSFSESKLKKTGFQLRRHFPKLIMKQSAVNFSEPSGKMMDSNWKARYDSITSISKFSKTSSSSLNQAESMINTICSGISDSHIKVQLHSLNTLYNIIPTINKQLNPYLYTIIASLCKISGGANSSIRELSGEIILLLVDYCDSEALLQVFKSIMKTSKSHARSYMFKGLYKLVNSLSDQDVPDFLQICCDNLNHIKFEIREQSEMIIKEMHLEKRGKMLEFVTENQMPIILKILNL